MDDGIDVSEILKSLEGIAMEDGEITEEEQNLISTVITNLNAYTALLEKAVDDNVITAIEKSVLFEQRMHVMEHAYKTAREDYLISEDETQLLKQVCGIILKLSKGH